MGDENFKFQSKLLRNRSGTILSLILIDGGRQSETYIEDILALLPHETAASEDLAEAINELCEVIPNKRHAFWREIDKRDAERSKVIAENQERRSAELAREMEARRITEAREKREAWRELTLIGKLKAIAGKIFYFIFGLLVVWIFLIVGFHI